MILALYLSEDTWIPAANPVFCNLHNELWIDLINCASTLLHIAMLNMMIVTGDGAMIVNLNEGKL